MKSPPAKLVLTCTGSIADADLQERLHRIKTKLQYLSQSDGNSVNLSKVEPWNSVRVTFNIPPEAAARLRELAQRGDLNLHKLGILTVQVENGETISLPPPPAENQHSLFSPPPPTPTEIPQLPQLPLGPPLVPPSPAPVMSPPVIPVSTPGLVFQGHGPGQGPGPSFQMPVPSLQQLTRPSFQGLQSPGPTIPPPFGQQGPGNLWNPMGISQQRPLQPPLGNFWNPIPQFFPQVNMSQPNNQQQGMVGGPPMAPAPQPKPQPKKRRKRTKKANIQPPDLAVAAGQPLLPLPPHLQNLPPSNTNIQDASDNLNTNKPSNLSLPPGLIDNPISPNTPPTTALSTSSAIPAPIVGPSSNAGNQFSFTDIPISRGLVPSPLTQQQLLQKRTDVTLTSPLLVNLLQSDISAKQFPFTNTTGSKTFTGTETLTLGMSGPGGQEMVQTSTALGNSSPFMLGNGLGTIVHPNSAIANMHPFASSQGSALGHPSPSGHFLPSNAFLQAQSGQLSQEQIQFQLSQLSAVQHSQAQGPHGQPFPGNMPHGMPCQNQMQPGPNQMQPGPNQMQPGPNQMQPGPNQMQPGPNQMQPGPNQMQLGHMQPFPGGHHMQGPTFPGLIHHSQLSDVRMSIGPAALHDQVPQGQITLGRPMLMGQVPSRQVSHPPPINPSLSRGKDKFQPAKQSPPVSLSVPINSLIPSVDPTNKPNTPIADKSATCMDYQSKESTTPSNSAVIQQGAPSEKNGDDGEKQVEKQPQESQVFDEETALLGMTEAERDTMAMAAIIAKEAKMAADAKNGKPAQDKDASTTSTESQHSLQMPQSFTAVPFSDANTLSSRASISTPITSLTGAFSGSQPNEASSKAAPPAPPVAERRPSNSPIRLSPPQMPESIKQRRTPPASSPKQIHHQPSHYGPIPVDPLSSMASGIAGLQTLTSRTFSTAAQPSIRDMALSRNPEHNTLSQFLRSVTPPSEILQMAPLFRSSKQQDVKPKPTSGFQPGPTSATSEWLSLPNVDAQKPLSLPPHVGVRTPMQPAEFSAATERMLGSMLDIQKPDLSNIERPPNQPRVITTEGINFMHKLVGRAPPSVPQDQAPQKESETKADQREQINPADQVRKEDKSQLKALLNEIVTPEKCPFEKQFAKDDSKFEKHHPVTESSDSVSLERHPSTLPSVIPHQAEQWFGFPTMSLTQTTTKNMDSLPKSGNITSIYIPPSGQQQQHTFNQPLSSAQRTTVTSTHTTAAPVLDESRCRNTVIQAGTKVAGQHLSDQMEPLKHFSVASPSVNPSQSVSIMQQVLGSEVADAPSPRHSQEIDPGHSRGFKVELTGAKTCSSSNQLCQAFTKSLTPTSPSVTQHHLSLQETPMTVLERVPPILMSPATFSTASQELMRTLGAHGPLAGLIPGSEQIPPAPQQMQNFPAKIDQLHAEIDAPGTPSLKPLSSVASFMSHFQPRMPKTDISSLPTINLQGEQQLQQARNESKDVQATDSSKAPHTSIVPATTSESASVSQTSMLPLLPPVQLSGEYSLKMPPTQFPANVPHQSPEIQPEKLPERISTSHELVLTKEGNPVSHDLPAPEEVSQFTETDVNRPASVLPQEATLLPELSARITSENAKQLEAIPQTSVSYETDKTTQPMYKKNSVDRHVTQQQLRTSASLAAFGFPPVPPSTNTSPVKPSAYPSASSTLAQAQSIMVKTGAMSRTSGIIKGTEQASRPVRSRTPPRASLSTLPPNTCNTESLGSASALLSSIAKSAWTVTTAMASAAKAKVVPTPKASDKNPPRLRRSPETLPLTGKTTGDRDKGNPTTDAPNQQIRTVTGLAAAKDTFKTSFTDLVPNIALPEVKDYGSSPRGSFQSLSPHIVVTEAKEPMRNTAMPTLHAAVSAAAGELSQVPLPINIPSSKLESGCRDVQGAVPQTSSQEWPLLSSPLTPSFTGQFQSMPTLSCSRSQQAENQTLHSVNIHSDVPQPQPSMSHEQQSPDANSVPRSPQEFLESAKKSPGCDPSAKASDNITTASNVASDLTPVPMTQPVHFPQDRYNLPQGDTSEKALVTQNDEEPQQLKSKSGDQPRSTVITSPAASSVKPEAHSKMGHVHVPANAVPTDLSSTNTASLYPPPLEPPKLVAIGEEDRSPGNFEHIKQSLEVGMQGQVQAQQQVGQIENDPPKASSTLASPDEVSMSETDAPTVQTAHQSAADFTPRSTETIKQGYQFKDGQIQHLNIKAKTATSEFFAFESVQPQRDNKVARTDPTTESASVKPCESKTQPGSVLSLEEAVMKLNTPPESVFLNKPDQITNLVEEVIQLEPDKDVLFERSPSTLSARSSQPSELSTSKANEPEHAEMKTEEFPIKPSDVKEHSKESGMKLWKDLEGEFEPRRTRHSSEEVPGMSTRSLRSGRRSPGEAIARTKEKEESPPATRGRGQKKEEMGSEMDPEALSRKRSTRSSGRDMYYGPIISYKRRKTNQK